MSVLTACIFGFALLSVVVVCLIISYKDNKKWDKEYEETMAKADAITKESAELSERFDKEKKKWK